MRRTYLATLRKVALALFPLLLLTVRADAAGFDTSYSVYRGYFNSDDRIDLYIASPRTPVIIPLDDLFITVPVPVKNAVLQSNADGSFSVISELTSSQRSQMTSWPIADVVISVRDVDMDGATDLELRRVSSVVQGGLDVTVLSDRTAGRAPRHLVAHTAKFRAFHNDLLTGLQHPNYFEDYAPLRVKSSPEPISRLYYGSIRTSGSFASTAFVLANCTQTYPGGRCYLTSVDPSPCTQSGSQFNDQNEYIGEGTRDVCSDYAHVFVYVPGSVQVEKDYSAFDTDAKEAVEIVARLQNDCSLFVPAADHSRLNEIMSNIFGSPIGLVQIDRWSERVAHPPAPGDELFNPLDPTFHHYDVRTNVCRIGETNCSATSVGQSALNYTHPSLRIVPKAAQPDGSEHNVYIPWFFWQVDNPSSYTLILGKITQRQAQSGYWTGAIQNVTTPEHTMYPGTITRKVFQEGNTVAVRTHGVGVNRTWCVPNPYPAGLPSQVQGARILVARLNVLFGDDAFRTVDRVLVDAWRAQNGLAVAPLSTAPAGVAVSIRGAE